MPVSPAPKDTPDEPVEAVEAQVAPALEAEPDGGPAGSPALPVTPEPVAAPAPDDARLRTSPFSRATALAHAEAIASQQSQVRAGASAPLGPDQLSSLRVEFLDQYDSRWQRDPGRANGPYS